MRKLPRRARVVVSWIVFSAVVATLVGHWRGGPLTASTLLDAALIVALALSVEALAVWVFRKVAGEPVGLD